MDSRHVDTSVGIRSEQLTKRLETVKRAGRSTRVNSYSAVSRGKTVAFIVSSGIGVYDDSNLGLRTVRGEQEWATQVVSALDDPCSKSRKKKFCTRASGSDRYG